MSEMLLPRKSFGGGNMKLSTVQVCDFIRSRSARFCFKQASTSHLHHQSGGDPVPICASSTSELDHQ